MREEGVVLEHETDAALLGREVDALTGVEQSVRPQGDPPAIGPDEAGHRPEHRRFTRPGRPDERRRRARIDLER
jgi:hypothetical protein